MSRSRLPSHNARELHARLVKDGWSLAETRGKHYRYRHPHSQTLLFVPSSPSDWRAVRNLLSTARRLAAA